MNELYPTKKGKANVYVYYLNCYSNYNENFKTEIHIFHYNFSNECFNFVANYTNSKVIDPTG
ncbi:MAG: hypothetical protein HeimC2_09750 [Candidatus Heimdallarchaeota archaeon LC_2]|nr:MAG: hypothetical protein HeimC2_09750 [Candidatus Heimdallarchaeota archaeon LC_2]